MDHIKASAQQHPCTTIMAILATLDMVTMMMTVKVATGASITRMRTATEMTINKTTTKMRMVAMKIQIHVVDMMRLISTSIVTNRKTINIHKVK